MKNEIIGVHENGTVAVRLPATKKGERMFGYVLVRKGVAYARTKCQ